MLHVVEYNKCIHFFLLQTVSVTVSVMTLTSISIDRWYAICHPLKFKSTTGRAKTAIIIIWIVGLASGILKYYYKFDRESNDSRKNVLGLQQVHSMAIIMIMIL